MERQTYDHQIHYQESKYGKMGKKVPKISFTTCQNNWSIGSDLIPFADLKETCDFEIDADLT
ncbi:hypothetical protein D918_04103 [Trichuris suis]|nr:hypothetical protein D918_04103 [Trichuris suis]